MKKSLLLLLGLAALSTTSWSADLIVNSTGRLIVHSNINVNAGSFIVQSGGAVDIDLGAKITATNVVYAGTLTVSSNNLVLASGSTFQLFNAPSYSGAFLSVNVPALSTGLVWQNNLSANGSLTVSSSSPPQFTVLHNTGVGLVLAGSGGTPNGSYAVLTSTNVGLPTAQWSVLATNTFDSTGAFAFTSPTGSSPQQFFIIELR